MFRNIIEVYLKFKKNVYVKNVKQYQKPLE